MSEDDQQNAVLIERNGRIAFMIPGSASKGRSPAITFANVIACEDEKTVSALLESGDTGAG